MEYTFTLKYRLPMQDWEPDALAERLGAAGCDDALVGIGQPGRIALEFTREAESAEAALLGALSDARQAMPSARLVEAAPDFVGLTDVADVVGVSRQNVRKLMLSHATSFPSPVHEGSAAIWHLAEVLAWFRAKGGYPLPEPLGELAVVTMQVNLARQAGQLVPRIGKEVKALLG
ncbi:DNA-binding protein [Cupriavidus sp. USMAA2-4]|uniref:DNA-binding protein n=1 Tax=Cupriavidus malaysiensis TaxID=367825 RepID=A0ABM6F5B1_9BURK|nr:MULTISPECIES: DNA-binding protein [Cupriavidus]AOY93770.1 DNA-binding protein [Cupriavidus sp. USMAA2-4]AOY99939.1 DNA-binding protein [Cupriavidus sp. USMAHM13]AOZ06566.1 DNA-binding protein [Cupriavidus malaysiensis]